MRIKLRLVSTLPLLFLLSCSMAQKCQEEINLLPMYGNQTKCEEQLRIDRDFLFEADEQFKDRKKAAKFYTKKGWDYFNKSDLETAMKRFNQAWLLDSLNSDVYWGFGNILGIKHQFSESLPFLEKSIKINPFNPRVYESISTSYGQMFVESRNIDLLKKSIDNLKNSIRLDPNNARTLGQLTGAYSYFMQKDSAKKYLQLTDRINPKAVKPEVRKMLAKD